MYKKYCICIVVQNRWNFTKACFDSLGFCDQSPDTYDVLVVDNGSDSETTTRLRQWAESSQLPLKNIFCIRKVTMPVAFNLAFLMAKDYDYRIKLDNDIVLHDTPMEIVKKASKAGEKPKPTLSPLDGCTDPNMLIGVTASTVMGAHSKPMKRHGRGGPSSSAFLDLLETFSVENSIGITALIPAEPTKPPGAKYKECLSLKEGGASYLIGGCMMIDKPSFDKLGYFNETIPRKIDVEYSQRALANGINIGYHPKYWSQHIGNNLDSDTPEEKQKSVVIANNVLNQSRNLGYMSTRWQKAEDKILRAAADNLIVQLR